MGHIWKKIQRLVKNGIIPNLEFTNLGICVECIKGKHTSPTTKKTTARSTKLLEIIHTDIVDFFNVISFGREKYLITFIDNFSYYGYVYLLHEKSWLVDALKVFINKVERQLDRKVKIIRFGRDDEYYRKYDELGQNLGPFTKFLEKCVICA